MAKILSENEVKAIREEPRFRGIRSIKERKILSSSSAMHDEVMVCMEAALQSGADCGNVHALEEEMAGFSGVMHAVALRSGTEAVHTALMLAAERIYGSRIGNCGNSGIGNKKAGDRKTWNEGSNVGRCGLLSGRQVFCSDLASSATVNPVIYEGGEPVFIDASPEDWGMDPGALEIAFDRYPDVKIVVMAHIYGFPGQIGRVKEICEKHGALLIEDACESLGAAVGGKKTGSFGDYGVLSFYNDDIMPDIEGGMLLINDASEAEKARRWILQSPAGSMHNLHGGTVCSDQIGNIQAGIIRCQMRYLHEYIAKKKAIYERYQKKFAEDLMLLNPVGERTEPSYQQPCMTVESGIRFIERRSERGYEYVSCHGTAAPMEVLEALEAFGAEGKPVWKPMHMQPFYKDCDQISLDGSRKDYERSGHNSLLGRCNESEEIFGKGICLPAGIGMTVEEQDRVIDIIFSCYSRRDMNREMWNADRI